MTLQSVTVKLPNNLYHRLERTAKMTKQSFNDVLLQTIRGNIPPSLEDIPTPLRQEFAALLNLNDDDLWAVAASSVEPQQWQRHQRLLQKNAAGALSEKNRRELERLRTETDKQVIRKSFALALLKWRGHTLSPNGLPLNHASA